MPVDTNEVPHTQQQSQKFLAVYQNHFFLNYVVSHASPNEAIGDCLYLYASTFIFSNFNATLQM